MLVSRVTLAIRNWQAPIYEPRGLLERIWIMRTRALMVMSVAVLLAGCYGGYAPYPAYSSQPAYYHYSDRSDYRGAYYYR